jgi:hypothetical protein
MRGGSQAQLVQGDEGNRYLAKFLGNPEGTEPLSTSGLVAAYLSKMDISMPNLPYS